MKKILLSIIPLILLISAGCAGGAKPAAIEADELDAAIREASDYLNTRIPNGNKVAFINISGGYPDLADYILSDLSKHGVNDGIFSVVDRAQLEAVRAELNFNVSGEVSDQSAQAIGQMLGAQAIVSGSVRKIGAMYRLDVKAIEVQTASVQGQWNRNIPNGATIAALTVNTGGGASAGSTTAAAPATGGRSGGTETASGGQAQAAATQPAGPQNGTYTFWPRPRAIKAGIPANDYLMKIVVNGRYMIIYLTSAERGIGGNPGGLWNHSGMVLLTNLDRPSQSWKPVSWQVDQEMMLSFEGVTATRFSLESGYSGFIYEEINLTDAEYEP